MNGQAHANIMIGAVDALPTNMQEFGELRDLLKTAPNYPDYFDDPTRPLADKIRIDPHWERYSRLPKSLGGGESLHTWGYPIAQQAKFRPLVEYWCGEAIKSYQQNDRSAYLKYIGCLSHMLGDFLQPAHLIDQTLIEELLPAPESMAGFHYHSDLEAVTGHCGALEAPVLLGACVQEISWHLAARNRRHMRTCRALIVPTLQALFAGNASHATELAGPPLTLAAQSTRDLLYSTITLARGDVSGVDSSRLCEIDLRTLAPDEEFHDLVYGGAILDGNRKTPPAGAPIVAGTLRIDGSNTRSMKGIGMLPHSGMSGPRDAWMRYELPRGVFERFEAMIGMNAAITQDGAAHFTIELDGRAVYRSGRCCAQALATAVTVPIGAATQITLRVEDANEGRTFWNNHAFWGEPRLIRQPLRRSGAAHSQDASQE